MPAPTFAQIKELQARVGKKGFDLKACKDALNNSDCDVDAAERALLGSAGGESAAPSKEPTAVSSTASPAVPTAELFDLSTTENAPVVVAAEAVPQPDWLEALAAPASDSAPVATAFARVETASAETAGAAEAVKVTAAGAAAADEGKDAATAGGVAAAERAAAEAAASEAEAATQRDRLELVERAVAEARAEEEARVAAEAAAAEKEKEEANAAAAAKAAAEAKAAAAAKAAEEAQAAAEAHAAAAATAAAEARVAEEARAAAAAQAAALAHAAEESRAAQAAAAAEAARADADREAQRAVDAEFGVRDGLTLPPVAGLVMAELLPFDESPEMGAVAVGVAEPASVAPQPAWADLLVAEQPPPAEVNAAPAVLEWGSTPAVGPVGEGAAGAAEGDAAAGGWAVMQAGAAADDETARLEVESAVSIAQQAAEARAAAERVAAEADAAEGPVHGHVPGPVRGVDADDPTAADEALARAISESLLEAGDPPILPPSYEQAPVAAAATGGGPRAGEVGWSQRAGQDPAEGAAGGDEALDGLGDGMGEVGVGAEWPAESLMVFSHGGFEMDWQRMPADERQRALRDAGEPTVSVASAVSEEEAGVWRMERGSGHGVGHG